MRIKYFIKRKNTLKNVKIKIVNNLFDISKAQRNKCTQLTIQFFFDNPLSGLVYLSQVLYGFLLKQREYKRDVIKNFD